MTGWYAAFLQNVVIPNASVFSYIVTFGEILVGLGLIVRSCKFVPEQSHNNRTPPMR